VHTQINISTPEEVLFFGTAAAAQKREKCAQLMEARWQQQQRVQTSWKGQQADALRVGCNVQQQQPKSGGNARS
jgi:hypothetical protein